MSIKRLKIWTISMCTQHKIINTVFISNFYKYNDCRYLDSGDSRLVPLRESSS